MRISWNRVQRRIFGPQRDEVAGGWRRLQNEELHNLYNSPYMIREIKPRRLRWERHVACTWEMRNYTKFLSGNMKGWDNSETSGVSGSIILE
jgi:hypothetical protein